VHWILTDAQSVVIEGPESEHLRMTHFGGSFDLGKLLLDRPGAHLRPTQAIDPCKDVGGNSAWQCCLGHLEHGVTGVTHQPGAGLDQTLAQ